MADKDKKKSVGPITFARQVRAEGEKVTWTSYLFASDFVVQIFVRMVTGS